MRTRIQTVLGLLLLAMVLAAPANAQNERQATAMREKVYDKLSKAQEATEAQDWDKAFDYLGDVERMRDLDPHEKAQLFTAYGYTYFAQEKYAESVAAYETVLEQENLPEALLTGTLYTLGQLYFHLEDYAAAAGHLETWLSSAVDPGPDPYILLGQAYYQLERPLDAAESVRRGLAAAEARGTKVQENWYALLRVIYFQEKDYDNLLKVLEILVTRYPSKEYWIHLSAAYGEMGDTKRQLAAYELAHEQGFLTTGPELVVLGQLLLQEGVPYRAGVLLEKGLADGVIESTARHWRLLSQAWTLSQDHAAAITALTRAAELSDDGELNARIAQSHANLGQWEDSVSAARTALDKGVKDPHELQMLMGMALFELGRFGEARAAFTAAQSSSETRAAAIQWETYVEREEARVRELGLQP